MIPILAHGAAGALDELALIFAVGLFLILIALPLRKWINQGEETPPDAEDGSDSEAG